MGQRKVGPRRSHYRKGETDSIGPILFHHMQRVNDIAFRLAHFLPFCIPDQTMDVNYPERHISHELHPQHDHPRNPEEEDVERCNQK